MEKNIKSKSQPLTASRCCLSKENTFQLRVAREFIALLSYFVVTDRAGTLFARFGA
jgi:hypothetical protein